MTQEIPKTYDPAAIEGPIYRAWLDEKCFAADPSAPGEPYCIVIPPPNVTGALHLGHAINDTLQDILIRNHRMRGFNTLWVPGIDHAGIATQAVVEKQLKELENKTRHDIGREALVARIWQWKQQYGDRILAQLQRLGCSCDWDRSRFTLDEMCAKAVRETFFKLFRDGLIYRGKRLVNWDVHLQTSISDDEIYHEKVKTNLWHIRYPISGTDKFMIVATTRPETMLGDTAVAVHSEDPRWNWAIGQSVDLPLTGRKIPIIADDILVDPKFGTGVVKVTPAHDPNDYAVWQRHQGKPDQIDILNVLNTDGTLNATAGPYTGMKRDAARKKVVEDLTTQGLLEKEEPYETEVGHSDRSKTAVEPYLSDQWFVKMAPLAEPALEVVRNGIIQFFPERHAQQYLSWLGEKRDWPISRQLWWGHRIPVWTVAFDPENKWLKLFTSSGLNRPTPHGIVVAEIGKLFRDLEEIEGAPPVMVDPTIVLNTSRTERNQGIGQNLPDTLNFCARTPEADAIFRQLASELQRQKAGGKVLSKFELASSYINDLTQDPDVLDTWFSSALWPHSTLGWPDATADLQKWYPTSVLVTGRDIITLWVARMVMMGMYNLHEATSPLSPSPCTQGEGRGEGSSSSIVDAHSNADPHPNPLPEYMERGQDSARNKSLGIPFAHVVINPTILDGRGERMSKTKGNGVDPVDVIDTHGADALRFTLTMMATETQDVRMPVKKDAQGRNTSDRFDVGRNFCNKIWQVGHFFVIANLSKIAPEPVDESKWTLADRWIVSRFNRAVKEAATALENYRFDQYAKACYDFFWGDFCDWYVEAAKPALRDSATAGQTANVLAAVLDGALRLMHPMIPFITEIIWSRLDEARTNRALPGRIETDPGKRLIKTAWPAAGETDDAAENDFEKVRQIIAAIRTLRSDYKVDVKKPVDATILSPADLAPTITNNRTTIELLSTCRIKAVEAKIAAPQSAVRIQAAGVEIFVEGLIDPETEKLRVAKRREELTKEITTLEGRLANEAYIARAPANLVEQTKQQLTKAKTELAKLE